MDSGRKKGCLEALAREGAGYGRTYRIRRVLFDAVRKRCAEMGLVTGTRLRVTGSGPDRVFVQVLDAGGQVRRLDRRLANFVHVEATVNEFTVACMRESSRG